MSAPAPPPATDAAPVPTALPADIPDRFAVRLPAWLSARLAADPPGPLAGVEDRMAFAVDLARRNVAEKTGGPFGAAVFAADSGGLIAAGVNVVAPSGLSVTHAEVVALSLAQARAGGFDLSAACGPVQLVTSAQPCGMCLGAAHWAGVSAVVCGARQSDVTAAGFDEGPAPADWVAQLRTRGVAVTRDVLRADAAAVLLDYARGGGPIYNAGAK